MKGIGAEVYDDSVELAFVPHYKAIASDFLNNINIGWSGSPDQFHCLHYDLAQIHGSCFLFRLAAEC